MARVEKELTPFYKKAILETLRCSTGLKELDLSDTHLDDEEFRLLLAILSSNTSIVRLNLHNEVAQSAQRMSLLTEQSMRLGLRVSITFAMNLIDMQRMRGAIKELEETKLELDKARTKRAESRMCSSSQQSQPAPSTLALLPPAANPFFS